MALIGINNSLENRHDFSCKWGKTVCVLLRLACFVRCNILRVPPHCRRCQNFLLCLCGKIYIKFSTVTTCECPLHWGATTPVLPRTLSSSRPGPQPPAPALGQQSTLRQRSGLRKQLPLCVWLMSLGSVSSSSALCSRCQNLLLCGWTRLTAWWTHCVHPLTHQWMLRCHHLCCCEWHSQDGCARMRKQSY